MPLRPFLDCKRTPVKTLGKTVTAAQALHLASIAAAMLSEKYTPQRVVVNSSQLGILIKVDRSICLTLVQNLNGSNTWTVNYDTRFVNFDNTVEFLTAQAGTIAEPSRKPTIFPDGSTEPTSWWHYIGIDWAKILAV